MPRSLVLCLVLFAVPTTARAQATALELGGVLHGQLAVSLSPSAPRELGLLDTPWLAGGGGVRFFLRHAESGVGASLGWAGSITFGGADDADDLERHLVDLRLSARVGRSRNDRFGLLLEIGPSLGALVGRVTSCSGSGWPGGYRSSLEPWEVVSRYEPPDPRYCSATPQASFAVGGSAVIGIELHFGTFVVQPHFTYRLTSAPAEQLVEHELIFGVAIGVSATTSAQGAEEPVSSSPR